MEIYETDPRSSVEAGWAVFQRDNLFLPITSSQVFNQSVIGAIRSAAIDFLQLFSQRDAFFWCDVTTFHTFLTNPQITDLGCHVEKSGLVIVLEIFSWLLIGYYPYPTPYTTDIALRERQCSVRAFRASFCISCYRFQSFYFRRLRVHFNVHVLHIAFNAVECCLHFRRQAFCHF